MPSGRFRTLASTLILALVLAMLACEAASTEDIGPSIGALLDETLTPAATTETIAATSTAELVEGRPSETPSPPPGEKPQILWMLRDHGGTNVAVVRFATNVEVTAVLSVLAAPGQPPVAEPQTATAFAREHTLSTPLAAMPGSTSQPTFLALEVTDRHGAKATASLEYGDTITGTQYWSGAEGERPAFTWTAPFKGNATWTAITEAPSPPVSVQAFARPAGCTTAEQCAPTPIAGFSADTRTPIEGAERHSIPVELPPTPEQDFHLLYTAFIDGDQPTWHFYQRDIPRSAAAAGAT